jgi:hypothetical protein
MNFESAVGARTNVFKLHRLRQTKRHASIQISVHAQPCPVVCRQVFESLIKITKNFSKEFLQSSLNYNDQQQQPTIYNQINQQQQTLIHLINNYQEHHQNHHKMFVIYHFGNYFVN